MDRYDEYGSGGGQLAQCDNCERSFTREALSRHRPICMKSSQKKRKVFDSSKQRAEGTELVQFRRKNGGAAAARKRPEPGPGAKKNNWRQKHADFINTIRAARGVKVAMERGEPLPPPPPPSYNPDYVQCDYCGRRFNETAAQRHINFCKEQHERLPTRKPDAVAAQKQAARLQYQAPKLKKGGGPGYQQQSQFDYNDAGGFGAGSRNSGYSPKITNDTPVRPRGGASFKSADRTNRNMPDHPTSGQVLRTGRTAQTYSEARQLSANQRAGMASRKYPSNDNIHGSAYNSSQYTGTGFTSNGRGYSGGGGSSSGYGMASRNNNNNTRYGGGGSAPRGRGGSSTGARQTPAGAGRFCYDCGAKFPAPQAKFCSECGAKKSLNA